MLRDSFAAVSLSAFLVDPANTTCTLGTPFFIHCRTPPGAVTSKWVYNNVDILITSPPNGLSPTSSNDLFNIELTCVPARHYATIQCVAIMSISPHLTYEYSQVAIIKVQGMPTQSTIYKCLKSTFIILVCIKDSLVTL